jgi:DNA-binding MarR family transcriptional regulator
MLTKAGIAVLDILAPGHETTPSILVEESGYSRTQIYRVLDDLIEAGLVIESRGPHNQRKVRTTDHPVVSTYRRLSSQLGHVEWPDLLSPAMIRVCWYLDEPRRITTIADRLGISRQRVHTALSPLKDRAILDPNGPEYALAENLTPLVDFVREVVEHDHRQRARAVAPSATVEWCDPKRALVRPSEPDDTDALEADPEWTVTGLAKFQTFGLQFYLAGEPAFWYGPEEELTPADIVCHTIVLGADSRRVSYAMLLIETENIEQESLASTATWYGLETEIDAMYRALRGEITPAEADGIRLPSADEYEDLKAQYGVA